MSRNEKENFPPSYSESIGQAQPSRSRDPQRGQNILDQLTLVRAQHIRSVIDTSIIPLVEERAGYGIAQTIIAMLPSDIPLPPLEEKSEFSFDTGDEKNVEVIGFSSDEEPKVVRLEGQLNKTEFWRPQAVIVELEKVLRESLNASPHLRSPTTSRYAEFEAPERPQKRSFFSRITGSTSQEEPSPGGNPEVGLRQPDTGGQVLVKARLEEICLRTVTGFGLYDTITKQCVIIRIDARC